MSEEARKRLMEMMKYNIIYPDEIREQYERQETDGVEVQECKPFDVEP